MRRTSRLDDPGTVARHGATHHATHHAMHQTIGDATGHPRSSEAVVPRAAPVTGRLHGR